MKNVKEECLSQGILSFDANLPQEFFNDCVKATGLNPSGHIVWSYDHDKIFGQPRALTTTGLLILTKKFLENIKKCKA